jgi:hypothetical protein
MKKYYRKFQENREYKKTHPWSRGNDSLVAVNPERITTLIKLAIEHYGEKCAKCGAKKALVVHHRHYRTIGFEKTVDDIVLLCHTCHDDLHARLKAALCTRDDAMFLDPEWKNLPSAQMVENRIQAEKNYQARMEELKTFSEWVGYFKSQAGIDLFDFGLYKDTEEAERNFKAEASYLNLVYVSFEPRTEKTDAELKSSGRKRVQKWG